jgi:predicted DNA-binding transcriptional regulator AlpA
MESNELLTVRDLAAMLGLNPRTIYVRRWRNPWDLPPCIVIGTGPRPEIRFRRGEVEAWLDARTERSSEASG